MDNFIELVKTSESLEFYPSEVQNKTKAKLIAVLHDNPIFDLETMSLDVAVELTKERRLRKWWNDEGFQDWFKNRHEFRSEVEDLLSIGLRRLRQILQLDDSKVVTAQINAIKLLMEVSNKFPKTAPTQQVGDAFLAKMTPKELEDYIKKHTLPVVPEPTFVITEETTNE